MAETNWKSIEASLEQDLARQRKSNGRSIIIGVVLASVVAGYLLWVSSQVRHVFDADELAAAASGVALEAVPMASQHLRGLLVDGAPDMARVASTMVVDMLPTYRQVIEDELAPVVDEVCVILAQVAVQKMVASAADGSPSEVETQQALQGAADAVVVRLDVLLSEALDEPLVGDGGEVGPTARESIEVVKEKLSVIDHGLQRIVKKQGDPLEQALVLGWMNLLAQQEEVVQHAYEEAYRARGGAATE